MREEIDCLPKSPNRLLKSICPGDLFEGILDLPIDDHPGTGSVISARPEITDLCRKTEISLTKGFTKGIQGESDPRVCMNAKQGLVGILEINPSSLVECWLATGPLRIISHAFRMF